MGAEALTAAPSRCANCEIEFTWPAAQGAGGLPYCCDGCAVGGLCTCAYEEVWDRMARARRTAGP